MIETIHRTYKITFDEQDETWRCRDLEILPNAKLSAVKRRIDEMLKAERKVSVPALIAGRNRIDAADIKEVVVTVLCEPETKWRDDTLKVRSAWIKGRDGRSKVDLEYLFPVESKSELLAWVRLDAEASKAQKAAADALAAIRRHDADSLMLASKEAKAKGVEE